MHPSKNSTSISIFKTQQCQSQIYTFVAHSHKALVPRDRQLIF